MRQGNTNEKVHLYRYVTKGTFDAYSYQTLESKQKFISQIMTSKVPARKCEDVDQQSLTYSEIKALCTGDERIKEKMMLDNEVKELRLLEAEHRNTVYEMQDKLLSIPAKIEIVKSDIEDMQKDLAHISRLPKNAETGLPEFCIKIGETVYTDKTEAAKALEKASMKAIGKGLDSWVRIGEFQGFSLSVRMSVGVTGDKYIKAQLQGTKAYFADFGVSFPVNLKRLEGVYNIDRNISNAQADLCRLKVDMEEAEKIAAQPFAQKDELKVKSERLETLTDELNRSAEEAKKNAPKQKRTYFFDCAKLRKEAAKLRENSHSQPKKVKEKTAAKAENAIE